MVACAGKRTSGQGKQGGKISLSICAVPNEPVVMGKNKVTGKATVMRL